MKLPKEIKQGNIVTVKSDQHGTITGEVILYGDKITPSMKTLIKTSKQHRKKP